MDQLIRHSVRALIINNNEVLLMYRRRIEDDSKVQEYYVTIGGGIDEGETPMQALQREVFEESGVCEFEVIDTLVTDFDYMKNTITGHPQLTNLYVIKNKSGRFTQPRGPEQEAMNDKNFYEIQSFGRNELSNLNIVPTSLKDKIIEYGKRNGYISQSDLS